MTGAPQLTFRTSDVTRWGTGQQSNLNAGQIDTNFYNLAQAIVALQSNPAQPVGIASVSVTGTQMSIFLTSGAVLGPFTLPVLQFRWRGAWEPNTGYAVLDTFTVDQVGIFSVMEAHTSASTFNPLAVGADGKPLYNQLFGAVDASLSGLTDVKISNLVGGQILFWNANDNFWENESLGTMAFQQSGSVAITGGTIASTAITGLPAPLLASDACTKAYADALKLGTPSIADATVMANMTGAPNAPVATSVSAILDHTFTTSRGAILYRTGTGWTFLAPGTVNQVLKSGGAGADISWGPVAAGVTDIAAGTGISTGGSDITTTGTVSLAAISAGTILANITGSSAAPTPSTLSTIIDNLAGNIRGSVMFRGSSGWTILSPGTTGLYLKTQGAGADPIWSSPAGAGTVTDIAAGTGISTGGSDITATGTISLASISDSNLLANISGVSAAPTPQTLTLILDHIMGSAQGDILYRDSGVWKVLAPGTSGQVLQTGGAAANPSWVNAPTGSPISDKQILANISGGSATAIGKNLSDVFDYILGSAQGDIIYRGASGWTVLAPGTSGQFLQTQGAAANPAWASAGGGSPIPNNEILANISGGSAVATGHTLSDVLDNIVGSARSSIIFRGGSGWTTLGPGTAGQLLQTGTASVDPSWITPSGGAGGVTSLTGGNNIAVSSATGAVTLSSNSINPTGTDADVVTWASIEGLRWKYTCTCATTAALPAGTYSNGTSGVGATFTVTATGVLTVDGHTVALNDIVLVKNQASAFQNGIYLCSTAGAIGVSAVLTRAPWNNDVAGTTGYTASIAPGDVTAILLGTANAGTVWMQTNLGSGSGSNIVVGTDSLSYSQIGGTNVVTSGGGAKYTVGCFVPGTMTASQKLVYHKFSRAVTFPANFGSTSAGHTSEAGGSTNATGSTVINVDKAASGTPNTFSNVGTITIASSSVTPTFATSGGATVTFSQGDVMRLVGPASADATFADFYATLAAVES